MAQEEKQKVIQVFPATVKRENWKGKYRVVARQNGHIVSWQKYSPKTKIETQRRKFKHDGSLKKGVQRTQLTNVNEIVDYSERPQHPTGVKYQYVIEGVLEDGRKITARSLQHDSNEPKNEAKEEALENFYEQIGFALNQQYDADEGLKVADQVKSMRQGTVYYRART